MPDPVSHQQCRQALAFDGRQPATVDADRAGRRGTASFHRGDYMAGQMDDPNIVTGMRITIVGAGGIGGTIGGHLARAGADVLLVDAAEDHVRAMRERGLTIETMEGRFTVPVAACHPAEVQGPLDVVLLAVKSQATVAAVSALAPHLGPWSWMVSAQNGLNEEVIARLIGAERTVGAFVNFGADYVEPGLIRYYGPAPFYLGELDGSMSTRVQALAKALAPWGDVTVTDNISGYLWTKLGYVAMLCATALVDEVQVDVMRRHPALMAELASEVYEVALAEGVRCEDESGLEPRLYVPRASRDEEALLKSIRGLIDYAATYHKPKSGIWRDLAVRKRKTEIEQGLGEAVRRGEHHHLDLPLVRRTIQLVHEIEEGRRAMSWANLADLERHRAAQASSVT
jgi:2-dehydropantoate 2-reductase